MPRKPKNPIDPATGKRRRGRPPKDGWKKPQIATTPTTTVVEGPEGNLLPPPAPEEEAVTVLTDGLSDEDRARFAALLRSKMSLEQRANVLIELASMTDSKRAPVALRAIQEINQITGLADKPVEEQPLFVLPAGSDVLVGVKIPKK